MFLQDIKIYSRIPEIRGNVRQVYVAKLVGVLTLLVFMPFILLGVAAIVLVHIFDFIGQLALYPTKIISSWLHEYQRKMVNSAHSKVALKEIYERIGVDLDENI